MIKIIYPNKNYIVFLIYFEVFESILIVYETVVNNNFVCFGDSGVKWWNEQSFWKVLFYPSALDRLRLDVFIIFVVKYIVAS